MRPETGIDNFPQRSLRDFYYILFRHKWKVVIFFLAVMITVTLGTFLAAEIYKSEARLLVRIGRESVSIDPTATTGQVISVGQSRESEINSELEILKSRELAQKVVDAIGPRAFLEKPDERVLGKNNAQDTLRETRKTTRSFTGGITKFLEDWDVLTPLDDREKAVITFQKSLEIESQKNSNILFLSYQAQGAETARRILAKLIESYLDKHITAHRTSGSYEFFDRQADPLRTQLAETEQELKGLKDRTGVASLDDQRKIILTRIGNLQQEAETTQAALAISRAKVRELRNKLAGLSENQVTQETKGTQNYGADLMRARLYELKLKEQELLSRYTESSVMVQEVRRQIAEAQALLANEKETRTQVTTGINPTYQQINLALLTETANLSSLEAKSRVLDQQLKAGQKEIQNMTAAEMRLVNLQRELAMQDTKYRKYSENLEQARIDQALETNKISNISVIQAATASMKPIKPRKTLNLALGFILGILGGLGLAFFSEYLDHSIKTPQEVEEKVKLQILASIPYLKRQ